MDVWAAGTGLYEAVWGFPPLLPHEILTAPVEVGVWVCVGVTVCVGVCGCVLRQAAKCVCVRVRACVPPVQRIPPPPPRETPEEKGNKTALWIEFFL